MPKEILWPGSRVPVPAVRIGFQPIQRRAEFIAIAGRE